MLSTPKPSNFKKIFNAKGSSNQADMLTPSVNPNSQESSDSLNKALLESDIKYDNQDGIDDNITVSNPKQNYLGSDLNSKATTKNFNRKSPVKNGAADAEGTTSTNRSASASKKEKEKEKEGKTGATSGKPLKGKSKKTEDNKKSESEEYHDNIDEIDEKMKRSKNGKNKKEDKKEQAQDEEAPQENVIELSTTTNKKKVVITKLSNPPTSTLNKGKKEKVKEKEWTGGVERYIPEKMLRIEELMEMERGKKMNEISKKGNRELTKEEQMMNDVLHFKEERNEKRELKTRVDKYIKDGRRNIDEFLEIAYKDNQKAHDNRHCIQEMIHDMWQEKKTKEDRGLGMF